MMTVIAEIKIKCLSTPSKTFPNIQKAQSEFGLNIGKKQNNYILTRENSNKRRTTVETIVQLPQQFELKQTLIRAGRN